VLGEPGGGKSSLVAAFARECLLASKQSGNIVIPHFVGAAPGSTNCRHMLDRLCSELKLVIATHEKEAPPTETNGGASSEGVDGLQLYAHHRTVSRSLTDSYFCSRLSALLCFGDTDPEEEEVAEDYTALKKKFLKLLERASSAVVQSSRSNYLVSCFSLLSPPCSHSLTFLCGNAKPSGVDSCLSSMLSISWRRAITPTLLIGFLACYPRSPPSSLQKSSLGHRKLIPLGLTGITGDCQHAARELPGLY